MRFIETILLKNENGEWRIENYLYHLNRVKRTFEYFKWKFNDEEWKYLKWKIKNGELINSDKYNLKNGKLRIVYSKKGIENIEIFPVKKREFKKFKIVYSDIDYSFKYENRDKLNALKIKGFDEVIIVKNGFITDTTISNLAFFDGKKWYTPKTPLLKGTKREELLDKGILIEKNITIDEIKNYKKFAMLNAILGFYEVDIDGIVE